MEKVSSSPNYCWNFACSKLESECEEHRREVAKNPLCTVAEVAIASTQQSAPPSALKEKKLDPVYQPSALPPALRGKMHEIIEVQFGQASFTRATDKKPIIATYGVPWDVVLAGYDPNNKVAFVARFSNVDQARQFCPEILSTIQVIGGKKFTEESEMVNIYQYSKTKDATKDEDTDGISHGIFLYLEDWFEGLEYSRCPQVDTSKHRHANSNIKIDARTGEISFYRTSGYIEYSDERVDKKEVTRV